jgi:FKBP-type peptidyl-prolyl cis-trans isomerase (trigger factor)
VERETERRLEDLVRRLVDQGVDPMKADINWQEFRERQKAGADESVRSTLVLDEIARPCGPASRRKTVSSGFAPAFSARRR